MAKPNVVYSVEVNGEEKVVEASSRSQAIRAATKPLVGKVKPLTAIELLTRSKAGAEIINAAEALKGEPAEEEANTDGK